MMEHTALLNGTTSTTATKNHDGKEKKGYTLLIFFTALLLGCAFYGRQIRGRSNPDGGGTRGATTAASLTMMSNDKAVYIPCETSVGSYVSGKDYCYTCGKSGVSGKMGFFFADDDSGPLGYCWNSQGCGPACAESQGVGGRMDGECGDACTEFVSSYPDFGPGGRDDPTYPPSVTKKPSSADGK